MAVLRLKTLFIWKGIKVAIGEGGTIYINGKPTNKLIPAMQEGQCIGVVMVDTGELVTIKSFPNYTFDTQLLSSVKTDKNINRVSKIDESKKFIPVSRVEKNGQVEIPGT